jgi:hypothetical protein
MECSFEVVVVVAVFEDRDEVFKSESLLIVLKEPVSNEIVEGTGLRVSFVMISSRVAQIFIRVARGRGLARASANLEPIFSLATPFAAKLVSGQ